PDLATAGGRGPHRTKVLSPERRRPAMQRVGKETAMDSHIVQTALPLLTQFLLKVLGALVLWIVGRALIRLAVRLLVRSLKLPFDQTVAGYLGTATSVLLNIALIVAILGFFGIETTSFAALLAGVGVAIGAAWSGLLSHLAAG